MIGDLYDVESNLVEDGAMSFAVPVGCTDVPVQRCRDSRR